MSSSSSPPVAQRDANAELRDLMKDCEGDKVRQEGRKQIKSLGQVAALVLRSMCLKLLFHCN